MTKKQSDLVAWAEERAALNEEVLALAGQTTKRFFSLDSQAYREGAIDEKHKELIGLAASMVLRCDDCVNYHIIKASQAGATESELEETLSIALIVGGSITIPHLRRAARTINALKKLEKGKKLLP